MKNIKRFQHIVFFALLGAISTETHSQCEADTTVYLTDFDFTPNTFTISLGQTVAFINAVGVHNVNGTADNNPISFFLEETKGDINGVCMGTVTFDVPGTYTFTSSFKVQSELSMTRSIVVDAEKLADVIVANSQIPGHGYGDWIHDYFRPKQPLERHIGSVFSKKEIPYNCKNSPTT